MKKQYLDLATEFLIEQMNHWMLFPPVMVVMNFTGADRPDLWMWTVTGLFPLLFFLIRTRLKNFWAFLAAHLAVVFFSLIIPTADNAGRLLCVLAAIGYLIFSLSRSLKNNFLDTEPCHPVPAAAVNVIAFLLQFYQGRIQGWEKYYIFALIGFFSLYNIVQYLQHFLDFVTLNRGTTGYLPVADMLRSGLGLVLGYTLFGAVIMALSANAAWLDGLAQTLKQLFFTLLRAFFSLFLPEEGTQEFTPEEALSPSLGEAPILPEAEESFWLWKVLEIVFGAVLVCGVLYLCIRGLIRLVRFLQRLFPGGILRRRETGDAQNADIREKCAPPGAQKRFSGGFSIAMLSPAARVRRLYKKTLLAGMITLSQRPETALGQPQNHQLEGKKDRQLLSRLTARESERQLQLEGMAEIYEKTRYSDRETTNDDVRKMKTACQKSKGKEQTAK